MAPGTHDVVLRDDGLEGAFAELPDVRRAIQFLVQFVLRDDRRASPTSQARRTDATDAGGDLCISRPRRRRDGDTARQRPSIPRAAELVELGCHHEQQHQELLLTDILHLLAQSPIRPAYLAPSPLPVDLRPAKPLSYKAFDGGLISIGHDGDGFAFDSEGPSHQVFVEPFRIADRLVTNGEWIAFMADRGYENPMLWLSEGWAHVLSDGWSMPLYWERRDDEYWTMTLRGPQPVDLAAPVTHVSYFEADAFATWDGRRLPTEMEWEHVALGEPLVGNFADSGRLRPKAVSPTLAGVRQMFGDVWEWTRSAFLPYPRFHAVEGAVGEYNGKFMSGQFVLRGGSCVTPAGHVRASYRNFFPPQTRWQFSGLRLAENR